METKLEKRYGLPTAISMVVGIVIGSGVFFKAVKVLSLTGGSMGQSLGVIGIVGLIMIVCSYVFATLGSKYAKCNGVVDYAEAALGPKYGYYMGWFMSALYYPILAATLAYISAQYTCMLFGLEIRGGVNCAIGAMYLMIGIAINALSPKLAGKLQVSTTIIKLIPLCLMGVVGLIVGLVNGNGIAIFHDTSVVAGSSGGMMAGVCAFAFSYEGWVIATSINSELKNPKRDLPIALIGGALFCTAIYMLYVYSMSATMNAAEIIEAGDWLPKIAFSNMFGNVAGTAVFVFIIISCLGTTNGLIMGCMRGFYSIAIRNQGPRPEVMAEVDTTTGMPLKSCLIGMALCSFWLFQFQVFFWGGPLVYDTTGNPWWLFAYEADEIVIITQYAMYIPIFLDLILKEKEFGVFKRFVMPVLGLAACFFLCYCCYISYGKLIISYLVLYFVVMLVGRMFYKPERNGIEVGKVAPKKAE